MTSKEIADVLGLKVRQIANLARDGMPRIKDGRTWDYPPAAIAWYFQQKLDELEKRRPSAEGARAEREMWATRKLQHEVEMQEALTLPWGDTLEEVIHTFERMRAKVLNTVARYTLAGVGLKTRADSQRHHEALAHDLLLDLTRCADELEHRPNGSRPKTVSKRARRRRS